MSMMMMMMMMKSDFVSGHASKLYRMTGMHLLMITCMGLHTLQALNGGILGRIAGGARCGLLLQTS